MKTKSFSLMNSMDGCRRLLYEKKEKKNSGYFSPVNELRGKILLEIMINTIVVLLDRLE